MRHQGPRDLQPLQHPARECTRQIVDAIAVDFVSAKRKLDALAKKLDYGCINDIAPFDNINPSAENIAQWFHRELSEAVKRRCLFLHLDYPDAEREREIVASHVPEAAERLTRQLVEMVATLRELDLKQYRIVHFATHAFLPTELRCKSEPTLLMSGPPGAANADETFLDAGEVLSLNLDADLVILSACNTAGPNGSV